MSAYAEFDFIRSAPGRLQEGLAGDLRTDIGDGDIAPETMGKDFFPYRPPHLGQHPPRLVWRGSSTWCRRRYRAANMTARSGPRAVRASKRLCIGCTAARYEAAVCGNAAQRAHGMISNDGPKNLADSVEFITSTVWADRIRPQSHRPVLIQEQQIFASRDVMKGDARPGGYIATGGHGGISAASGLAASR